MHIITVLKNTHANTVQLNHILQVILAHGFKHRPSMKYKSLILPLKMHQYLMVLAMDYKR